MINNNIFKIFCFPTFSYFTNPVFWPIFDHFSPVHLKILHNCKFFKWNRVKMVKNGFKMVEIFLGASHMINDTIFNIFCFSTFSFGYFLDLVFRAIFSKFGQNTGFVKYPKEKVEKQKNVIIYHMWGPPKNFNPFLVIFGHFYPISLDKFALTPKTRLPQFTRNLILTPTGK